MDHVRALTEIGPRPGDTATAREAAAYIERAITEAGGAPIEVPVGGVDLPAITVMGRTFRGAARVSTSDPDIVVRFGPAGRALLIMAHYDTVPGSPGAVDNAAAVGVVIELARVLAHDPPPSPVILAFTANEEIGLVGAEGLARQIGDEVAFAVALDLIGGSGDLVLNGASELIGAEEMRWIASAADRAGVVLRAPLAHRVVSRWWPQAERSDHGAFTRRGTPSVHFYNRGQDGEWIDLAYHSERDVLARVDRGAVDETGRLLLQLTRVAPPAHGGDGFWLPVLANRVISRSALLAIELVLAALTIAALLRSRTARARGGLGLAAGALCYAVATACAFIVERIARGDHPGPWLHAPLAYEIALALVLGGVLGLVAIALRRWKPWIGDLRYAVVGAAIPLAVGLALVAIGAAELAWIWLVPAAIIALAPQLAIARWLSPIAAALPMLLVLAPNQLREAAWNGFLPATVPLALLLAVFALPVAATITYIVRRRAASGPLGSFVLPVGCLLSVIAGVIVVSRAHPPCEAADFNQFRLACEVVRQVR
jgi:hypothetical protein